MSYTQPKTLWSQDAVSFTGLDLIPCIGRISATMYNWIKIKTNCVQCVFIEIDNLTYMGFLNTLQNSSMDLEKYLNFWHRYTRKLSTLAFDKQLTRMFMHNILRNTTYNALNIIFLKSVWSCSILSVVLLTQTATFSCLMKGRKSMDDKMQEFVSVNIKFILVGKKKQLLLKVIRVFLHCY